MINEDPNIENETVDVTLRIPTRLHDEAVEVAMVQQKDVSEILLAIISRALAGVQLDETRQP